MGKGWGSSSHEEYWWTAHDASSGDKEARPEFHPALVGLLLGSLMING